jgi:Tol biopolymer transport system component
VASRRTAFALLLAAAAFAALAAATAPGASARQSIIAYEGKASARGFLYLRTPDGSPPRRVRTTGRPSAPAISPLGRRIAFSSGRQIWVVYVDGTALRQVTTGPLPAREPAWAPSAAALAFAGGARDAQDIYRVAADGSDMRRLTVNAADEEAPAWSSRNRIAFVRRSARGDGDIFTLPATGGRPRRLTRGKSDDGDPAWSPDGRFLAFTRVGKRHRDIWVMRVGGGRPRRLTRSQDGAVSPTWSPNGQSVAFSLRGEKGRRWLYVVRRDGRRLRRVGSSTSEPRELDWRATDFDPVVAAAGDIACDPGSASFNGGLGVGSRCGQKATSDSLMRMDLSAVLALGDLQYEDGQLSKFLQVFDPTWGRLKPLIHPVLGNHEYRIPGAGGYFDYFNGARNDGPAGERGSGYYSFDVGTWHVVALNSECLGSVGAPSCAVGSPQERWLRADLAAHPQRCTLAFWHHPLVSSGRATVNDEVAPLWQALVDNHADLVLTGHDHAYERFAPINAAGAVDPVAGLREFVVGTGGKGTSRTKVRAVGSELRLNAAQGVLELTLGATGYSWQFVRARAGSIADAGTTACH